jgi:hypothetical protein
LYDDGTFLMLFMEYVETGSLRNHLTRLSQGSMDQHEVIDVLKVCGRPIAMVCIQDVRANNSLQSWSSKNPSLIPAHISYSPKEAASLATCYPHQRLRDVHVR